MRWSYKTVHFSLKKDGLLGNAFLDEAEIEVTLNEYGKSGWELVSFMEVSDGLIAVFKQPFAYGLPELEEEEIVQETVPVRKRNIEESGNVDMPEEPHVNASQQVEEEVVQEKKIDRNDDNDVGSIRIG